MKRCRVKHPSRPKPVARYPTIPQKATSVAKRARAVLGERESQRDQDALYGAAQRKKNDILVAAPPRMIDHEKGPVKALRPSVGARVPGV